MDPNRKAWNQGQQALRQSLAHPGDHRKSVELFMLQHGTVHSRQVAQTPGLWSFEDDLLQDLTPTRMRQVPPGGEHSIAWILWHLTRIEDVTMNVLVAGTSQLLLDQDWLERLKTDDRTKANAMDAKAVHALSLSIDLQALRSYRTAVGRRTQATVKRLRPGDMLRKTPPERIERLIMEGAVVEAAGDILNYWAGLTVAGLLLMPPTRHTFLHLNEGLRIKNKLR